MSDSHAPRAHAIQQSASSKGSRMLAVQILSILYRDTDAEHGLTYTEIIDRLADEYRIAVTYKTVQQCCAMLYEMAPFDREILKIRGKQGRVYWAAAPVLDEAELRLLADGLTLSRIDPMMLKDTVKTLQRLAGDSAGRNIGYLKKLQFDCKVDRAFFFNICELSQAISQKRAVSCGYSDWNEKGELVPKTDAQGNPRQYIIDPYQLVYKLGHYYLICRLHNCPLQEGLSYWRADHITDVVIQSHLPVAPANQVLPGGSSFDVLRHMDERPYPISGTPRTITVRTTLLSAIFDWFPSADVIEVGTTPQGTPQYQATFEAVLHPTVWWALQYSKHIEVLDPPELRDMISEHVRSLADTYLDK